MLKKIQVRHVGSLLRAFATMLYAFVAPTPSHFCLQRGRSRRQSGRCPSRPTPLHNRGIPTMAATVPMTRGVGLYRTFVAKSATSVAPILRLVKEHCEASPVPKRATVVAGDTKVVLVEEWDTAQEYEAGSQSRDSSALEKSDLVASHSTEYFPEALHISKPTDASTETLGILVRQKAANTGKGGQLRDAQREAYERQMVKEPGCTGCIILAGSKQDDSQVRIIEIWKTMDDFHFHEKSDWHAQGEAKVVPLVVDMDCGLVKAWQLIQDHS